MTSSQQLSLAAYHRHLQQAFHSATEPESVVQKRYQLAGVPVVIKFSDERIAAGLTPGLSGREQAGDDDGLVIYVWDDARANSVTPLPQPLPHQLFGGEQLGDMLDDGGLRLSFAADAQAFSSLDFIHGTACYHVRNVDEMPSYTRAEPFLQLFYWWLATFERHLLHAACVGLDGAGALIVGRSGQGKSTTALSCLDAGFQFLSDDKCLYHNDGSLCASALYSACKLQPSHAHNFPALADYRLNGATAHKEKAVMVLDGYADEQMVESLTLRAILIPTVTQEPTAEVIPASPGAALRALAPSTLRHYPFPHSQDRRFAMLADLVRRLPAYHLRLGADLRAIPGAVADALARSK